MMAPAGRTVDAVAVALESVDPAWLHARAARFDEAESHLAGIADGFRSVLREVVEVWQRYEVGGAPPALGERSTQVLRKLEELRSQQPGAALRRAADSLAQARLEVRHLRAASAAGTGGVAVADERALAVLNRIAQDFVDAGSHLLALPYGAGSAVAGPGPDYSTVEQPIMRLAGASPMELRADDSASVGRWDLPAGPGAWSSASSPSSLPDATAPAGGQPMMPMMPMGMGAMGAMGPIGSKDRQPPGPATADAAEWHEPDDGWETVGRTSRRSKDPSRPDREGPERELERMIDDFRDGRVDPMALLMRRMT
jgi:hypothetical protein